MSFDNFSRLFKNRVKKNASIFNLIYIICYMTTFYKFVSKSTGFLHLCYFKVSQNFLCMEYYLRYG